MITTMVNIECIKCGYTWNYKGDKFFACCPRCSRKTRTSINEEGLYKCDNCRKHFDVICVHHISYYPEKVVRVCRKCHRDIHKNKEHKYYPINKGGNNDSKY